MNEQTTTMEISKNMARAIRIIKNTQEYRTMNAVITDALIKSGMLTDLSNINSATSPGENIQNGTGKNNTTADTTTTA